MKCKIVPSGLLVLALSALNANAWHVVGVVSCPLGNSAGGIVVTVEGVGSTTTTGNGAYLIDLPATADTYTICVDKSSLPVGASVGGKGCQKFSVDDNNEFVEVDFTLGGDFCTPPPPQGPCWLTGGGTIGKTKGVADYSFGGVVNPGCSPTAAGGGNWNVVDHLQDLHFQGQLITVDMCGGSPTSSPKVDVNTIDFHGTGILTGVAGNPMPEQAVCFIGHAEDHHEPGAGKDLLCLKVYDCNSEAILMLISTMSGGPVPISTGNLQIHTSSCGK